MSEGKYWNSAFAKLVAFELLCQFGTNLVNPIVSNYAVAMGSTLAVAGFLAGLNSLCAMFLRPLGGLVLRKASKKALLVAAAVVFALSSLLCATLSSVLSLGASRLVLGAAFVIKSSLVLALASVSVPREYVGRGVGLIGLTTIVASALGPGIGSWVGLSFGYQASFMVSAALFILAVLVSLSIGDYRDADKPKDSTGNAHASARSGGGVRSFVERFFLVKVFPVAGIVALLGLIFGSLTTLVLLVCEQRGIAAGSTFFFVYAVVTFVVRPFSSKVYDESGLGRLFYPTAVATCLSVAVLAFASNTAMVVVSAAFLALGQGCLYPLLQAEAVSKVSAEESPLAANTFLLGADAGMSLGPIICGAMFQAFGSTVMLAGLLVVGVIMTFSFPFYSAYVKREFSCSKESREGV